jgi:hypothetical protein
MFSACRVPRSAVATLLLLALGGCAPTPAPEGLSLSTPQAEVWGRWEAAFQAAGATTPETELRLHLTSPSGREHRVDGFWDGGSVWRVRFMPDEPGRWTFRTTASPAVPGLDRQSGGFTAAVSNDTANPLLRHGRIRTAAEGYHFEHADGTPFFWLGDTSWNGPLLAAEDDWEVFLRDRAQKRFSLIQFVTTQWRAAEGDEHGRLAYTGFENLRINPEFFQRLDQRVDAINRHGMIAAPVLLWALGTAEGNPGFLPEDQAIRLARYMVARYGAHHVVWFLGGDGDYSGDQVERWRRIGRAVFDSPGHAPVTLHGRGRQWPFEPFLQEPWFTFIGYQSGHGDDSPNLHWIHSGPPATRWREGRPMPVINLEPPYEDHVAYQSRQPHSAYNVRRAVYWSLMNTPTAGVTYGVHGVWSWEVVPREPLNHQGTGIARPWHQAAGLPGSFHMRNMADLMQSLPWWRLRPAQDLLVDQPGGDDPARFVSAARTEDGGVAVLYLPVGGSVRIRTDLLLPGTVARWYEASTAHAPTRALPVPADGILAPTATTARIIDSSPGGQVREVELGPDWVLVLTAGN